MVEKYHSVVIGAGPGGYTAALRMAAAGKRVALVEKSAVGGTCLNRGCIPTKALLHSSELAAQIAHADVHGIRVAGWKVDWPVMMQRKNDVVKKLNGGVGMLLKSRKVDVLAGTGRLTGTHTIDVELAQGGKQSLEAEYIIVATGSKPMVPGIFPADRSKVMTSDEILDLKALPESLLIVGGGYIGCEFATIFSELGCKVTVVEMMERLLPMGDKDISAALAKVFKGLGVQVHMGTAVEKMDVNGDQTVTTLKGGQTVTAALALISAGRGPVSDNLGLEQVGVKTERGFVVVDGHCRTSVQNIFAIGDVTGKVQLAHVAARQADLAVNTILGQPDREDYAIVPAAVYTHPEIASVGLTLEQAQQKGLKVRAATFSMMASGMATAYGQNVGFVKLVADEEGAVVGAHLMCPHASDIVQEIAVMMKSECTLHEIAATIHGHPSFCEAVKEAADIFLGRPLHGH